MQIWVALLRGINVGGRNRLPMEHLTRIFEAADCEHVRAYIQSGNVVFDARIDSADRFVSKSYTLTNSLLYFHAPDGIARSRFAASIDRILRVQSTARNWRTITELEKLLLNYTLVQSQGK